MAVKQKKHHRHQGGMMAAALTGDGNPNFQTDLRFFQIAARHLCLP